MKSNTGIIVKIVASTIGEFHNQLMCYNAFVMYYFGVIISNCLGFGVLTNFIFG